jgi:hypothetical protein
MRKDPNPTTEYRAKKMGCVAETKRFAFKDFRQKSNTDLIAIVGIDPHCVDYLLAVYSFSFTHLKPWSVGVGDVSKFVHLRRFPDL